MTGGAEVSVACLIHGLAEARIRVHVLAGNEPSAQLRDAIVAGGGSITIVNGNAPTGAVPWEHHAFHVATRLHDVIARHHVRVVHVFSHSSAVAAAIAMHGFEKRPLVCASFHEMSAEDTPAGLARTRYVYGLKEIDQHLPVSEHYRQIALRHGVPPWRLHRVRQGVPFDMFARGERGRGRTLLSASSAELLVLCPGRFTPWKGQLDLLEAVAQCRSRGYIFHTVLLGSLNAGSVPYLRTLESRRAALELKDCVDLLLDLPYADMADALAAADLVVLPSHREGFGLAGLEAMAAGRPLVATDVSGFDEYCVDGQNCRLVPAEDVSALVQVMCELLADHGKRDALGLRGEATAAQYDASVQARDVVRVYARLCPP
ncbi:glycosyltransferase family 4 protein [Streptomyces sp. NPDC048309]|uniref:glycosyltransferase family 4 protein n=1 Tax=Streptomyces sp. NPDC048309 TaxID=3154618 RepID=UPI0033CF68B8